MGIYFDAMPMWDWNPFLKDLAQDLREQISKHKLPLDTVRMVGLLFARPESVLAKTEILPNLGYFHVRSANFISVFCAGYSDHRHPPETDSEVVPDLKGRKWRFSNYRFNQLRQRLESHSKWQYSGAVLCS
jgi:hypothetical protein